MRRFKQFLKENVENTQHFTNITSYFGEDNVLIMSSKKMVSVKLLTKTRESDYIKLTQILTDLNIQYTSPAASDIKFGAEFEVDGKKYRYFLKPPTSSSENKLAAEDFEAVICTVQNYQYTKDMEVAYSKAEGDESKKEAVLEVADAYRDVLLNSLQQNKITGILKVNGRVKDVLPTQEWIDYAAEGGNIKVDKTPKTDIIGLDGSNRISVKKGASQLLSAASGETYATFKVALDEAGVDYSSHILELIKDNMGRFKHKSTVGDIKKMSTGDMDVIQKEIYDSVINNKEFRDQLRDFLTNDEKVRHEVVREAMTGMRKFGNTNSTAEYIMVLNPTGNKVQKFKKISDVVSEYASNVKIEVAFKSAGQNKWSAFRMITEAFEEAHQEMLNEGFGDIIRSIKDYFKVVFDKILTKIRELKDKILAILGLEVSINCTY